MERNSKAPDRRRGAGSRSTAKERIDLRDSQSLRHWMRELDVDEQTLKNAVKTVGAKPDAVRGHIALHAARLTGRRPPRRAMPGA